MPASPTAPTSVDLELTAVSGEPIQVPDPDALTHLQFRRFAGCPICNLHLRSVTARHDEIVGAGIREVVFFHSTAEDVRTHTADLPFAVIADADKRYYRQFGVESHRRALLNPRVVLAAARGAALVFAGKSRPPAARQDGGRLGLPADFLIGTDGLVLAVKYGEHADDQWTVDELLSVAADVRA